MKKLLLSTAFLALTAGAALAADLPSRKAEPLLPPPPPPPMWTGFYAGLNAGYGFGTNDRTQSVSLGTPYSLGNIPFHPAGTTLTVPNAAGFALSSNAANNQSGFIGGAQFGYNYQWGQNVVIGIETDIQGTGIRAGSFGAGVGQAGWSHPALRVGAPSPFGLSQTAFGGTSVSAGLDFLGTVRGRIGYLWTPTLLAYATGGFTYGGAYANVHNYANTTWGVNIAGIGGGLAGSLNQTYVGGGSKNTILTGWNVGGGLEWLFMPNWSLKAEGIYYNLGNMTTPTAAFGPAPITIAIPGGGALANLANNVFQSGTAIGATRVNYQGVIARVGVNYHFNWGAAAPIVAKY